MLIKRNKYFSAIEEEEYLDQKEFNSKAQKALRKKWEIKKGLPNSYYASFAEEDINRSRNINRYIGKPVSAEEIAVNTARYKNSFSPEDPLKIRQVSLRCARRRNPEATLKDDPSELSILRQKKALADKKKAAIKKSKTIEKAKTAGKVALGTAAVIGTGVVAKKLYDRKKKKNADQGNK